MKFESKYAIGDIINLFGFDDWPCVISSVTFRPSGAVEYRLEWNANGEAKCEWYEEKRLELLVNLSRKVSS